MSIYIDLHIHSTCSDGVVEPEDLPRLALEAGLSAISITDHDTVNGLEPAMKAALRLNMEFVPGVEISTIDKGSDIHILGYYIDWHNQGFLDWMKIFQEGRIERAYKIVHILKKLGLKIDFDHVLKIANGAVIGRPHIAKALVNLKQVASFGDAFVRYLAYDKPAYLPKHDIAPPEAINILTSADGIPILAHPGVLHRDEIIPTLIEAGLMGIEAYHPLHPPEVSSYYKRLAKKNGIVYTGGSDFHGEGRGQSTLGCQNVTIDVLENLKALVAE